MLFQTLVTSSFLLLLSGISATDDVHHGSRKLVQAPEGKVVDNQYIVTFSPGAHFERKLDALQESGTVVRSLRNTLKGAVVRGDDRMLQLLMQDHEIVSIQEDHSGFVPEQMEEPAVPWHLDRLDQESRPLDGQYETRYTGKGVKAYVIDSGMLLDHEELEGRASCSNATADYFEDYCTDELRHGTRIGGLIGGATVGVAKDVEIISIKVCGDDQVGCLSSAIVTALEHVIEEKLASPDTPMVINLSLGEEGRDPAVEQAIEAVIDAGLAVITSAGNQGRNACRNTPAFMERVITVGGTTVRDFRWFWSNWGSCVDILAPGAKILTSVKSLNYPTATNRTNYASGTSFASALVAGAAALYLEENPDYSPEELIDAMGTDAVEKVKNRLNSPNKLLNLGGL